MFKIGKKKALPSRFILGFACVALMAVGCGDDMPRETSDDASNDAGVGDGIATDGVVLDGTAGTDAVGQDTAGQDTGGQDTGGQDTGGQDAVAPNTPPTLTITLPKAGATITLGESVSVAAELSDAEDSPEALTVVCTLDDLTTPVFEGKGSAEAKITFVAAGIPPRTPTSAASLVSPKSSSKMPLLSPCSSRSRRLPSI